MKTQVLAPLRFRNASCMLHGMKRTIALAALILLAMTGTAQAKAPDPKAACKQGGFVGYVNPATGQPFTDQGQCVSFVARGGTLVPAVVAPTVSVTYVDDGQVDSEPGSYQGWYLIDGLPADTAVRLWAWRG